MKHETLTNAEAGKRWRRAQAQRLLHEFERDQGRRARDLPELEVWVERNYERLIARGALDAGGRLVPRPEDLSGEE